MISRTSISVKKIGISVAMGAALLSTPALASKDRHPAPTGANDSVQVAATMSPDTLHHWPHARLADLDSNTLHHWPNLADFLAATDGSSARQADAAVVTVADLDPSTLHHWPWG